MRGWFTKQLVNAQPLVWSTICLLFAKSVALALVSEWEASGCRLGTAHLSPTKKMQSERVIRFHLKKLDDTEGTRFTSKDHHFSFFSNLPLSSGSKLKKRQMKCRYCKQRRTVHWCKNCEVPLCRAPCFIQFHSKPEEKVTDMAVENGKKGDILLETPRSLKL